MRLDIAATPAALAQAAAAWLLRRAESTQGRFTLALSGGTTPRALYEVLAALPYRDAFPWARTHIFWSDERFVPPEDALSNVGMARAALLNHVPIPPDNIHAPAIEGTPEAAAAAYDYALRAYHATLPGAALFDVVLLGLGTDGHTASLFPGTAALNERTRWVIQVTDHVPQPRLTLTYPALAATAHIVFLVSGTAKADPLRRVLAGDTTLPAARVTAPDVVCFADTDAAPQQASPHAGHAANNRAAT